MDDEIRSERDKAIVADVLREYEIKCAQGRVRHKKRPDIEHAWLDNKGLIELQGRQLYRRFMDAALSELDRKFSAALDKGEVLDLGAGQDDLRALMFAAAKGPALRPDPEVQERHDRHGNPHPGRALGLQEAPPLRERPHRQEPER